MILSTLTRVSFRYTENHFTNSPIILSRLVKVHNSSMVSDTSTVTLCDTTY
jgi:hypothetical protein